MSHFSRFALVIGAPLAFIAMLACVMPAGAKISVNGIGLNGISANGALGDLNGVAVEAVIILDAATR